MLFLLSAVYLGWALGANDTANIFGTGVTTRLISYRVAVSLTAVFVLLGALIEGTKCLDTVGRFTTLSIEEAFLATLAAATTVTILTFLSLPASTSHSIIGAVSGVALYSGGIGALPLSKLSKLLICWITTPLGALVICCLLYSLLSFLVSDRIKTLPAFTVLMKLGLIVVGCYGAYALGANNVANVVGAFVGASLVSAKTGVVLGGLSIVVGSVTFSKRVMNTVGSKITPLDPFSALVVIMAEAITVHIYTQIGVPVSTSQAVVGAVAGIGLISRMRTINRTMLMFILIGWVLTPVVSAIFYVLFQFAMAIIFP